MMQTVTKFVEQGNHFIMGEQRRFAADRTVEVTGKVGHWFLQRTVRQAHLPNTVIHPRAAAFVLTGVEVKIETTAQFIAFVIQLKETHIRMPDIDIMTLFRGNTVNPFHHFKQAAYRFVFREVRAQLFVANAVQMLLLFFAVVSDIPRLQLIHTKLFFGERTQLRQLSFTLRTGAFGEIGQEVEYLRRVFRHFGRQRFIGIAFKTEQLGQLVTQGENFRHHRAVIPFTCIRPLVRGASAVSAVHLFAQRLVVAIGHHRQIARNIQRQQVTLLFFRFGLRFSSGQRAFRHTRQLRFVGHQFRPAHGRIQHVVAVLIAQFGQARGNFAVAFLFLFFEANTGQFEITQGVIDRFLLRNAQGGIVIAIA